MRHGIIIPYRKREDHLKKAAPILSKYGKVFVIEQADDKAFNRGKLINAGFITFKDQFDYFTAHDVDLLPLGRADYSYSENPCHLAAKVEHLNNFLPYEKYFGGVSLIPNIAFEKVNGFNNDMFGWGAEDDELRRRFDEMNIPVTRRELSYSSLPHVRNIDPKLRANNKAILKSTVKWGNGLTSCKFEIYSNTELEYYTLLKIVL